MEDNKIYFDCYEISPGFLKGQLQIVNPFERIFKDFLDFFLQREEYNLENYNKLVRNYYIYKNQFKKYGLTFQIRDGDKIGNKKLFSKIFFFPKKICSDFFYFKDFKDKFSFKGKDYILPNFTFSHYKEKDDKAFLEIRHHFFKKKRKKF